MMALKKFRSNDFNRSMKLQISCALECNEMAENSEHDIEKILDLAATSFFSNNEMMEGCIASVVQFQLRDI